MKFYFTKKEQIVILIVIGVIVIIPGYKFFSSRAISKEKDMKGIVINTDNTEDEDFTEKENTSPTETQVQVKTEEIEEVSGEIIVHISGEIKKPGIIELPAGKRLIDAVELLGGLTADADANRINLAKKLKDEEKIYIPKIGEELDSSLIEVVESSNEISADSATSNTESNTEKININTCTKESLNTLPGIGEVISTRIIEYREATPFNTIDDIMNVSGIGDKKFEGLKDLIIVK